MGQRDFKDRITKKAKYQKLLYRRGYLLTTRKDIDVSTYPFFGNWREETITPDFSLYIHCEQHFFARASRDIKAILIGHAYNPFSGLYDENSILDVLLDKYTEGESRWLEAVSELTGIHLIKLFLGKLNELRKKR